MQHPELSLPDRPAPRKPRTPRELKLVSLRECPTETPLCDTPEPVVSYLRRHLPAHPLYSPDVECLIVVLLNTRRRLIGHVLIGVGTLDSVLVHAREIFRPAIAANAHAVVLAHTHPSGDPSPSEADIKMTRDIVRAGQLLKIELLDHLILGTMGPDSAENEAAGRRGWASLRSLGYFCS